MLKMYILVKDSVPLGKAINSVAHTSLATYLKFKHRKEMKDWLENSFAKVTVSVTEEQFEQAKSISRGIVISEKSLDGQEVCIGLCPREEWPGLVRSLPLYGKLGK